MLIKLSYCGMIAFGYSIYILELQEQFKTDLDKKMTKQTESLTAQVETVRSNLVTQSEVVKQLQSDVRNIVIALRVTESQQQRQMKESWWHSIGTDT